MKLLIDFESNSYVNFDAEKVGSNQEIVLLKIHGDISNMNTYLLDSAISAVFKHNHFNIILDCSEAEGFGTITSGIIMAAFKESKKMGGQVVLLDRKTTNPREKSSLASVRDVLGLAFLDYYDDLGKAIFHFHIYE